MTERQAERRAETAARRWLRAMKRALRADDLGAAEQAFGEAHALAWDAHSPDLWVDVNDAEDMLP